MAKSLAAQNDVKICGRLRANDEAALMHRSGEINAPN
jgi:hypothetical protein